MKSLQAEDEIVRRKMEKEEILRRQIQQQEKEHWEERMRAELAMTEKIQMEKEAKISKTSKLPVLKISHPLTEPLQTGYSSKICLHHKSTANLFQTQKNLATY